jgi:hypothetical protein
MITVRRNFVQYWQMAETERYVSNRETLDYAASSEYQKLGVTKGDTVWVVTGGNKRLMLVGQILVDRLTDFEAAQRMLGRRDLYGGQLKGYLINRDRGQNRMRLTDITDIAGELTFVNKGGKRTKLDIDAINRPGSRIDFGNALQTLRTLTVDSAALLQTRSPR